VSPRTGWQFSGRLVALGFALGAASGLPAFAATNIIGSAGAESSLGGVLRWLVPITVSAGVALLVLRVNTQQTAQMHKERLQGDHALAREKMQADIALAQRKLDLDRELATWRRKAEIAEQTLALCYEARSALNWARTSVIFGGEGKTRVSPKGEDQETKERRDSYFIPIERLHGDREVFAKLRSLRFIFVAYFGEQAAAPFLALLEAHRSISSAASILMEMAPSESFAPPQNFLPLKHALGLGQRPDETDKKLDDAMAAIERTCQAVLSGSPEAAAAAQ
jgi:hypothetical protein